MPTKLTMYQVSVIPYGKTEAVVTLHSDGHEAMRTVERLLFEVNTPEWLELRRVEADITVSPHAV